MVTLEMTRLSVIVVGEILKWYLSTKDDRKSIQMFWTCARKITTCTSEKSRPHGF